ncbi:hypothetical protein [Nocardia stercoris]|uniref:hypothetical protein n=1 Tax=Nocardia stercoris TaxID=2483361 RepID=UPI0011C47F6C|nr:hypothetical protein [Nocardia stercoris]
MLDPRQPPIDQRLDRLERKLDLILGHLGLEYVEPGELDRLHTEAEIDALVRQGNRIEAIRRYRALHPDISLMQARIIIESRTGTKPPADPQGWEPTPWEPQDRL